MQYERKRSDRIRRPHLALCARAGKQRPAPCPARKGQILLCFAKFFVDGLLALKYKADVSQT
jgi:hypothetical protein